MGAKHFAGAGRNRPTKTMHLRHLAPLALSLIPFAASTLAQDGGRAASRPAPPASAPAAERIFSGPQLGEKVAPFRTADVTGGRKEREFDPVKEAGDGAALYFFFPGDVNRIVAAAIREVAAMAKQGEEHGLKSVFVALHGDQLAADQRLRDVWTSLKPPIPASVSVDGAEGPGSWGLDKRCTVTVVLAKEGKVVFNYAALSASPAEWEKLRAELGSMLGAKITARPEGGRPMGGEMGGREGARPAGRRGAEGADSRRAPVGEKPASRPEREK